jgi:hypothetical protein
LHALTGGTELRDSLANLKVRLEREYGPKAVFFFPERDGVLGYWGLGPVVFVAERPTRPPVGRRQATHAFSDRFYDLLKVHGFAQAHVTDLVKHFPGTGLGYARLIELNWPYLIRELEIVQAQLVVAVGSKVRDEFRRRKLPYATLQVPHYSYRYGAPAVLRQRLDDAFFRVRAAAEELRE